MTEKSDLGTPAWEIYIDDKEAIKEAEYHRYSVNDVYGLCYNEHTYNCDLKIVK